MKIFLDTADYDSIAVWIKTGIIDGVTTNPTLLSKSNLTPTATVKKIIELMPTGIISVEVTHESPGEVYKQAHAIAQLGPSVLVKIPCHYKYYPVIKKLVNEGITLNITLVFSVLQALMMSKLGVSYISPFIGRLDDINGNGLSVLEDSIRVIKMYNFSTLVLAASVRTVAQLHQIALAGAHAVTVPPDILKKAVHHPLTDQGIELFARDWQETKTTQFP